MLCGCRSPEKKAVASDNPAIAYQAIRTSFEQGDLQVALQAVKEAEKSFAPGATAQNADWLLKFRLLEAEILIYQGRGSDALAVLNNLGSAPVTADLAIRQKVLLAWYYMGHGHPDLADQELQDAKTLSLLNHSSLTGEILLASANAQLHRGNLAQATAFFQQSLQIARTQNQPFLISQDLMNLGYVALEQEQYDQAVELFSEAVRYAQSIHARQVIESATGNAGVAYFYLGDYEKALLNFQTAEQNARKLGAVSGEANWLWNEGRSYAELGHSDDAKQSLEQALRAATAIGSLGRIAGINAQLGFLLYRQHQYSAAETYSDAALEAANQSGDAAIKIDAAYLNALVAAHDPNSLTAEALLLKVLHDPSGSPSLRAEVQNALANFYAGRHESEKAETWYRRSIQTFETERATIKDEDLKLPFFANGDALYRDYAAFLIASHKNDAALQLLDQGRARTLEEGLDPAKKSSHALLQSSLHPSAVARTLHATILFYSLGRDKSWLWAVTPQSEHLFILPGRADIQTRVQSYQKNILQSSDPIREANPDAQSLYNTLIAPAASLVPRNSRVFIIPDGSLNGLNFETLLAPATKTQGLHYWIEDADVTNASSIQMLSHFDANSADAAKTLLLMGNPVSPSPEYENLPNAVTEITEVQSHFPASDRTVLTQSSAVPAAYSAAHPERFAYIDFVAHGTASRLSPLDSAVILSAPPGHPDNFKLYARDILRHPLRARLVTISACYGSGLRAYAGEGLVGLAWAFLRAGAHNVIGALWQASDASTPQLMNQLYTGLNAGQPPDAALRAAKLSLIHSQSVYRKPLYWAAFQLYAGA
jgi:CHAT domain-containing protein